MLINKILARLIAGRHVHEWVLHRSVGTNRVYGNITFKIGSRLHKFCQICGKTARPSKDELKDNPPIFDTQYDKIEIQKNELKALIEKIKKEIFNVRIDGNSNELKVFVFANDKYNNARYIFWKIIIPNLPKGYKVSISNAIDYKSNEFLITKKT
jgi:hypothetical protein